MWKYVSRRIRDTFEKSASYFDKRSTTNVVNTPCGIKEEDKTTNAPCRWFCPRKCWNSFRDDNNTNSKRWNFEHLNHNWIGAITWSSCLVMGWYATQLIHLKYKYHSKEKKREHTNFDNLKSILYPYLTSVNGKAISQNTAERLESLLTKLTPTVHLISNEDSGVKTEYKSDVSTSPDTSENDLGDVLNSIENKLGLAAIENGQHQEGINLLRSAANRSHAPAIYNLGLCYELGLGVVADEKMAMTLFRSAAALQHPRALYNLGIYYGQGRGGLTRNQETAKRLLKLAAVQGQPEAITALEILNEEPPGSPTKEPESWMNASPYSKIDQNMVPMQSTLFIDNVGFLKTANCEARVY